MEKRKPLLEKLKHPLRFVLFDDQSYEELKSTTLSGFQVLTRILSVLLLLFCLTVLIIAFSPLREYIPGYSPPHLSEDLVRLSFRTDELLEEIQIKDQKLKILEKVLRGEPFDESSFIDTTRKILVSRETLKASREDSIFRAVIERKGRFDVFYESTEKPLELINTAFYAPLKGLISNPFKPQDKHFGIDVLALKDLDSDPLLKIISFPLIRSKAIHLNGINKSSKFVIVS